MERHDVERLATLEQLVKDGFDGINRRLDVLNGTVARHELRLQAVEAKTIAADVMSVTRTQEAVKVENRISSVENRLDSLQEFRTKAVGIILGLSLASGAIGALVSVIVSLAWDRIQKGS